MTHIKTDEWAEKTIGLRVGDYFTIEGEYAPRTLWQWLTRRPAQLQRFKMFESTSPAWTIYGPVD